MKEFVLIVVIFLRVNAFAQVADSSQREVRLDGAINFRDLGGYATMDGKHVKWRKIYRSAALNRLTTADLDKLKSLSLSRVADFRGPYEVQIAPDRLPMGITRISLPAGSENIGDSNYSKNIMQQLRNDSFLLGFYSNLTPFTARYKPMFDQLLALNNDSALLFHCTAGKDRTGIGAALVLYALGVDEKTIMEDYLATNYYRSAENDRAIVGLTKMYHLDEQTARNVMAAKPEYLQATFNAIRRQYSSLENYLNKEMGLDPEKVKKLRLLYLN